MENKWESYENWRKSSIETLLERTLTQKELSELKKNNWYIGFSEEFRKEYTDKYQASLKNKPCSNCGKVEDLSPAHLCSKCGKEASQQMMQALDESRHPEIRDERIRKETALQIFNELPNIENLLFTKKRYAIAMANQACDDGNIDEDELKQEVKEAEETYKKELEDYLALKKKNLKVD